MELFEEVVEAVRGLVPPDWEFRHRTHRYGTKVWFGPVDAPKEHFEAQVIGAELVPDAEVLALEIGWHAEHRDPAENEAAIAALGSGWEKALGDQAVAGPFIGRDGWRRLSETWPDPDLDDPELGTEVAMTLFDYITAITRAQSP